MVRIEDIREIHLEPATLCNARCPMCQRNVYGYPHNFGYPETYISIDQIKKIFSTDFVSQLESLIVCGNFGDFVVNPHSIDIIRYFQQSSPDIAVRVSTNGSARDDTFWRELGTMGIEIHFCIDGLEDTHTLYRLDTDWHRIIHNAQTYIKAGGHATWRMIQFQHNVHQVDQCRALAKNLGFSKFELTDHDRSIGPVFDRNGKFTAMIGAKPPEIPPTISHIMHRVNNPNLRFEVNRVEKESVDCYSKRASSVYLAANGEIYPCCFLGFYPRTFVNQNFHTMNEQVKEILQNRKNNALEVGLVAALDWFSEIEQRWKIQKYSQGRLITCDAQCGKEKYIPLEQQELNQNINDTIAS